ncbi:hypothetical protein PybrP1_000804 [[Pythium] brassicae (nom. inval.)]|nr:hypothetical protein PybrP1_000804 [[Pythium] brassicae (nom. inval.)]
MDAQHQQLELVLALRAFVDALRAVKSEAQAGAAIADATRALCVRVAGGAAEPADRERLWHDGLVPALRRLSDCVRQLDALDAQRSAGGQRDRPEAPLGLLSLRDYAVLQAALEVLFTWAAHPRVAAGVLLPVARRRPTKTLGIAPFVLLWGSERVLLTPTAGHELLEITRTMLELLFLPQFQPLLLPKYAVELAALLVFGETCGSFAADTQREFQRLRETALRALPLRLSMTSLRAALGQTSAEVALQPFKQRCGQLLSQLLMEPGGVMTTIEMLLSSVDEGNTQARMQVATLICQCPSGVAPAAYARALSRQVTELLSPAYRGSKLLCETAVLLADKVAGQYPTAFASEFVAPLFGPLLLYEDTRAEAALVASEAQVLESVTLATLLLCGPPPSQSLLQALAPVVRPLLHLYGFAAASKSELAPILQVTLVAWIKACHGAAAVLQLAVLPVTPPLPELVLASGGYERDRAAHWRRRREFCAGGSGGVALRMAEPDSEQLVDGDATAPLKALLVPLTELLSSKELESSEVVGELFASLLLTYLAVRRATDAGEKDESDRSPAPSPPAGALSLFEAAKVPTDASGVEMVLSLLLAIIESLGPSVLRSAGAVLSCIGTVLETYNEAKLSVVDAIHDPQRSDGAAISADSDGDSDAQDDGDEMLTICLGVVATILEAGASNRSDAEEAQLRAMLPVLEVLSRHPRPEIAELASDTRVKILVRGGSGGHSPASATDATRRRGGDRSFDDVLSDAQTDLKSTLVPLRARGVVTLTKLVRASQQQRCDPAWTPRVQRLVGLFLAHLDDPESYVFLAAVQGLAALADAHADVAIPLLVAALRDRSEPLARRIKLSEALLFSAKRCGETLPVHAKTFVFAYLDCIRPPAAASARVGASKRFQLIQEIGGEREGEREEGDGRVAAAVGPGSDGSDPLAEATLRASCLSNLAEVCVLLQWGLQPFVADVMTCVFGILQLELDATQRGAAAVRRGAVFVLKYVVQLLGWKVLEVMPEQLRPLYHTLKVAARTDSDAVVVFHATQALEALDHVMRAELFPAREAQDSAFGISSLRIVR